MAIKEFFNKAAKGVKTLFKKDGLVQSTFNKGSAIFDKGIGTALKIGGQIGRTARDIAPALATFNPALGAAAYSVGSIADKGSKYLSGLANKKSDIVGKINEVRNKLTISKPMIEPPQENINFA